jgi:replicative DNA helicase
MLQGQGATVVKFIVEYWRKFDDIPSESIVKKAKGILLGKSDGVVGYWIEQVKKRSLYLELREGLDPVIKHLEKNDPEKAFEKNIELCRRIWATSPGSAKVESLFSLGPKVKEIYMKIKRGEVGIPTPWEDMTEATLGFWPGDFVVAVARLGVGKCNRLDNTYMIDPLTGKRLLAKDVIDKRKSVYTLDQANGGGIKAVVPDAWILTGRSKCLEIKTRLGRKISVTPEHPMLTQRGWVRADRLNVREDWIVGSAWLPEPVEPVSIPVSHVELMAILLADGNYTKRYDVTVTKEEKSIVTLFKTAAKSAGLDVSDRKAKNTYSLLGGRAFLNRYGIGCDKSINKCIPDVIWKLPNVLLARFIEVFWACDGEVRNGGRDRIEISLSSEKLVDELVTLLLRFGIVASKSYRKVKCEGKEFNAWRLRVEAWTRNKFRDMFHNMPGPKGERLELVKDSINPNTDVVPSSDELRGAIFKTQDSFRIKYLKTDKGKLLFNRVRERLGLKSYVSTRDFVNKSGNGCGSRRYLRALFDEAENALDRFKWMVSEEILFDKLISVEDDGDHEVGDFTINSTHNYIANNLVAHNTWAMILVARAAWLNGYKVLFVCTEMAKARIAQRFYAIHLRMNYQNMRRAKLGDFAEAKMFDEIDSMIENEGIYIVGDDFDITLDSIEAAIYETRPDIVVIDGMYLVKVPGVYDRHTRVSMVADHIKKLAKRYGIVGCASTQFNRTVSDDDPDTIDIANIGITDVIGWDADIAFALVQTGDFKQDGLMKIMMLKMREGEIMDLVSKWDFKTMDFGQADKPEKAIKNDDLNKDDELFL